MPVATDDGDMTSMANKSRITGERAGRLYKLLKLLASNSVPRTVILKRLRVGIRSFYRDVDLLRSCGVDIVVKESEYSLPGDLDTVLDRVPFPDPELSFAEILVLMKGRQTAHHKLRQLFGQVTR